MLLELYGIEKSFDSQLILRGISLRVAQGEIVVLLGPSGCGKTTLLRIIAGLEIADKGQLLFNGQDLADIPVHDRGFGMVFQDYALFPHKSVSENVAFGLRMQNWDQERQDERVKQVLELVSLAGFGNRRVYDLSGGEQQRVALARALAPSPRLMLLDEPLGSLDRALRERLMGELRDILKSVSADQQKDKDKGPLLAVENDRQPPAPEGMTSIYVTHDQEEAFAIADRVFVMNAGKIEQEGTPISLYRHPRNAFVARFLGMENLLPAEVASINPPIVKTQIGDFLVEKLVKPVQEIHTLLIRPEAGQVLTDKAAGENVIRGKIVDVSFRGRLQIVRIVVNAKENDIILKFDFDSTVALPTDCADIWIKLDPRELLTLVD
jgi:ABC-type Fe3+/spermidine/putrescine transport system ATPase subunit